MIKNLNLSLVSSFRRPSTKAFIFVYSITGSTEEIEKYKQHAGENYRCDSNDVPLISIYACKAFEIGEKGIMRSEMKTNTSGITREVLVLEKDENTSLL